MTQLPEDIRFENLPKPTREVMAIIDEGFRSGLTQAEIQALIKKARGQGIRDDFLRQGIRFVRGDLNTNPPSDTKFISRGSPDLRRYEPSKGPILKNFSYQVAIINEDTDEIGGRLTVISDRLLDPDEVLDEAEESIKTEGLNRYAPEVLPDRFRLEIEVARRATEKVL